jgi:hypothetical protein
MDSNVKIEGQNYVRSIFSPGVNLAFDAYLEIGHQLWRDIKPIIKLGPYYRELPEIVRRNGSDGKISLEPVSYAEVHSKVSSLFDVCLAFDGTLLENLPSLDCSFGSLPIEHQALDKRLLDANLIAKGKGENAAKAKRLLAAAAQLLHFIQATPVTVGNAVEWEGPIFQGVTKRRKQLWATMRKTDVIASDYFRSHLNRSRILAESERSRYLMPQPKGASPVLNGNRPDFMAVRTALLKLMDARKKAKIYDLKGNVLKTKAIVLGHCAVVISDVVTANAFGIRAHISRVFQAAGLAEAANIEYANALSNYIDTLQKTSKNYPIICLLAPRSLGSVIGGKTLAYAIDDALKNSEKAIDNLLKMGASLRTIPKTFDAKAAKTPLAMAKLISGASLYSIWKLPHFRERAMQRLRASEVSDVQKVIELAATMEDGRDVKNSLAHSGLEIALLAASFAGPVGVAVSLQSGLIELAKSVREYNQLKTLFDASIDPSTLLLGLEHEEASKIGILLSLVGVLFP